MIDTPVSKNPANEHQRSKALSLGYSPCIICGRPIADEKRRYMVHVHNGGASIVTEEEADALNVTDAGADLGGYAVGPECIRQHPEIKPYLIKVQED